MADDEAGRIKSLDDRFGAIEQEQERQGGMLSQIAERLGNLLPGNRGEAQERTEARLDRPSTVAEQVRAELARAREEEAAQQKAESEKSEQEQMKADLAALREKPPAPPTPRRTKALGWGD